MTDLMSQGLFGEIDLDAIYKIGIYYLSYMYLQVLYLSYTRIYYGECHTTSIVKRFGTDIIRKN